MNKEQAEFWVDALTKILSGRNLVAVQQIGDQLPRIRLRQSFEKASVAKYSDGTYSITMIDSYGVTAGLTEWSVDLDQRAMAARKVNGYGETCWFLWVVDEGDQEYIWREMNDLSKNEFRKL